MTNLHLKLFASQFFFKSEFIDVVLCQGFSLACYSSCKLFCIFLLGIFLFSPLESGSLDRIIWFGFKWFQSPFNCSCGGLNCGPPYQVKNQLPLGQLTIDFMLLDFITLGLLEKFCMR
jgi:hypothetical protein